METGLRNGWEWASSEEGKSRKPVPPPQTWYFEVSVPVSSVGAARTCLGKASVFLPPRFGVAW